MSPIARTGPVTIYSEDTGFGDPVILLHGYAADHRVWDAQAEALAATRHRVIRPDLRGHGRSESPATGYQYADHLRDLTALIGHIGVGAIDLVGHSLGGAISLVYALQHTGRIRSLILVAPGLPGFGYSAEFSAFSMSIRDAARTDGVRSAIDGTFLSHAMFDGIRSQGEAFEKLRSIVLGFQAPDLLSDEDAGTPPTVLDQLSTIAVPTLVVIGESDTDDFRLIADLVAETIPNAEKVVIPGAGHMLPMEKPDELNAAIIDFLKRVPR